MCKMMKIIQNAEPYMTLLLGSEYKQGRNALQGRWVATFARNEDN